jgi:hypothetical protein
MSSFPPNQDFSVQDAIDRSYGLAMESLGMETQAIDISRDIADQWYSFQEPEKWWRRTRTPQNPATRTDLATYRAMEPLKKGWVEDDKRPLGRGVIDRWMLEAMVEYGLKHQPMYMAVMIGNVLFSYQNAQAQRVLEQLDKRLVDTDAMWKDRDFRRAADRIVKHLKPENGKAKHTVSQFLTLRETTHKNEPKRFKVRQKSPEDFAFVRQTLINLTPLDPGCPFPESFYNGRLDIRFTELEQYFAPHLGADARELVRKHVLLDPVCWEPIYNQLGFEEPERKLNMPDYSQNPRVSSGSNTPPTAPTPMNRSAMQLSPALKQAIAKEAEDKQNQRRTFVASSVRVVVRDGNNLVIPVNNREGSSHRFELDDGDSFIELHGTNNSGSMLLRTLFVSWNEKEIADRAVRHVVKLVGGGKLKFLINYRRDDSGTPVGATVDVTYIPKLVHIEWPQGTLKDANAQRSLKWMTFAVLIASVGGALGGWYLWRRPKQSSDSTPIVVAASESNDTKDTNEPKFALASSRQAEVAPPKHESTTEAKVISEPPPQRALPKKPDTETVSHSRGIAPAVKQPASSETKSQPRRFFAPVVSVAKKFGSFVRKQVTDSDGESLRRPMVLVTDKKGRPIHGAFVYFKKPGSDSNTAEFVGAGEVGGNSNKKGEYKPDSPWQLKRYDLIVKKDGFEDARHNGINVERESPLKLHIKLARDSVSNSGPTGQVRPSPQIRPQPRKY